MVASLFIPWARLAGISQLCQFGIQMYSCSTWLTAVSVARFLFSGRNGGTDPVHESLPGLHCGSLCPEVRPPFGFRWLWWSMFWFGWWWRTSYNDSSRLFMVPHLISAWAPAKACRSALITLTHTHTHTHTYILIHTHTHSLSLLPFLKKIARERDTHR